MGHFLIVQQYNLSKQIQHHIEFDTLLWHESYMFGVTLKGSAIACSNFSLAAPIKLSGILYHILPNILISSFASFAMKRL
jgi:hypothetical protein